ncbi:4Fe-4S binding protein [Rhodococcus sp. (in: high G+C Gram-positive bacteria)]|uniref:4Fe-4S dicluster domain-containing protein n=1 Tax=Rhodococcus sp. TaxID=1831 RepID=UPI002580DD5F|nr:4Fe-4S binding protein [Rhodococcus sp. (in: high G+C Gram-positive bacteria)]
MTHVITRACCNDASCVAVCPVGCIHPTPDSAAYASAEMLHIDPDTCIDCGACVSACPVDAIVPQTALPESLERYRNVNADYFTTAPIKAALTV